MSKVKIQGNASGTGVVTLTAPNTNTDRTITLPDDTQTLIGTNASGNVGIGVTAPQELLHLKDGSIAVGNGTASNNTQVGRIGFSTDSANSRFIGMESYRGADAANGDLRFHTYGGDSNAGERLRITNDGRGLSQFTAKAWCRYDDTASSITDSHNISSLTDNGVGRTSLNFSNSLGNASYASAVSFQTQTSWLDPVLSVVYSDSTAGLIKLEHRENSNYVDCARNSVIVFGD